MFERFFGGKKNVGRVRKNKVQTHQLLFDRGALAFATVAVVALTQRRIEGAGAQVIEVDVAVKSLGARVTMRKDLVDEGRNGAA